MRWGRKSVTATLQLQPESDPLQHQWLQLRNPASGGALVNQRGEALWACVKCQARTTQPLHWPLPCLQPQQKPAPGVRLLPPPATEQPQEDKP